MTRSNNSDYWHDQLSDYVLGNLSPDEIMALQEQIAINPDLAKECAELQESLSALPYTLPTQAPSSSLKASILEAAQESNQAMAHLQHPSAAHLHPSSTRRSKAAYPAPWLRVGGAIAATLVIALGIDNYRLRQQVGETAQLQQRLQQNQAELDQLRNQVQSMTTLITTLQEPTSIVYSLTGTGPAEGATGRLVTTPGHQDMVLVSENLPLLSEDQIYRLWAIADEAAQPAYCGQFRTNVEGTVQWTAPAIICSETPSQLLITLDNPTDSIDSAGPLVMQSQT